ncbi:TPA: hypothetical protein N0F65_004939 [Lagenidium giganteum]|uniref:Uncharacterized protein n=1 Tax=Lagenidium giganteum TaxID=4803 RepID=A0AAV2YZD0_9STRA|nr:TPA: hypothetical protein N0F65_004939 [Lagenidium giganteum]
MDHGEEGNAEAPPRSGSRSNSLTGSAALDDDSNLSNRTLSDDIPSPVHRLQGSASSAAMSLASAAKSKLSIGGRKLLSPLTAAASAANNAAQGSTKSASTESTATPASSTDDPLSPTPAADSAQAFRQVSVQQRMQILEELVQYRRSDWNYLKAMHEGSNYWFNIALLREQQVLAHLGEKQTLRRSLQFYYLGLGLGKIIGELQHPQFLAMEGCQLLEELEFYFSSTTVQSMVRSMFTGLELLVAHACA